MAAIPVTAHNIIDYVAGLALMALPPLMGLPTSAGTVTLQLAGAATILTSLVTAYRFSVLKLVPFRIHVMLDVVLGIVMLVAGLLTLNDGPVPILLLAAGLIYLIVPALSWPPRLSA